MCARGFARADGILASLSLSLSISLHYIYIYIYMYMYTFNVCVYIYIYIYIYIYLYRYVCVCIYIHINHISAPAVGDIAFNFMCAFENRGPNGITMVFERHQIIRRCPEPSPPNPHHKVIRIINFWCEHIVCFWSTCYILYVSFLLFSFFIFF